MLDKLKVSTHVFRVGTYNLPLNRLFVMICTRSPRSSQPLDW
ncbi:hypothetical protein ACLB1O_07940 [Escherichia coli]